MITIEPYKLSGTAYVMTGDDGVEYPGVDVWVFDDERTGLQQEALISGTDEIIEFITKAMNIPDPEAGFKLTFSDDIFDGYQLVGYWIKEGFAEGMWIGDIVGNWYLWNLPFQNTPGIQGWLCPALFLYFKSAPQRLYIRVDPK